MVTYDLIIVLSPAESHVLMVHRTKDPYMNKYNFPGGRVEKNEELLDSAYRELEEETGISSTVIKLTPFIDFTWHPVRMKMHVYIGRLMQEVILIEELHPLEWVDIRSNFFDTSKFAGEGNIGHMIEIFKQTRNQIFHD